MNRTNCNKLIIFFLLSLTCFNVRAQTFRDLFKTHAKEVRHLPGAPVITDFQPRSARNGDKITIIGSNLYQVSVKIGGKNAKSVQFVSANSVVATIDSASVGAVFVCNKNGSSSMAGFIVAKPPVPSPVGKVALLPTITLATPMTGGKGDKITIVGTNFDNTTTVTFGDTPAANVTFTSPTSIVAEIDNGSTGAINVTNGGGSISLPGFVFSTSAAPTTQAPPQAKAGADFTLPDVGQSNLNLIVTPSFAYFGTYIEGNLGVKGSLWGNSFGTDSTKEKVGAKFLIPQSSMLGVKIDMAYAFSKLSSDNVKVGPVAEMNFLWKKVSYYDTLSKTNTNFTPFVIHSKLGLALAFFKDNMTVTGYYNLMKVGSANDDFKSFFVTKKSFLAYPEIDSQFTFNVGDNSKQEIKFGIDMIINSNDAKLFSGTHDALIPYIRIGVVSKL